jgi:hypothetical protein
MKRNERVRLHLTTKRTIDGVLLSNRRGVITLGDALVEDENGKMQRAAGLVLVDRARVEFAQTGWVS